MAETNPKLEKAKEMMAKVYKDGFNIYQCLNKLKKQMKSRHDFPPEAIIWTCEAYFKTDVQKDYPWFLRVFRASSDRYFSEFHEEEGKKFKKEGVAQPIKDIMKGMFDG